MALMPTISPPRNRDTSLLLAHDLFRKPVSTFRDHALDGFVGKPNRSRVERRGRADTAAISGDLPRSGTGCALNPASAVARAGHPANDVSEADAAILNNCLAKLQKYAFRPL
jgi:hypothetical protein